MSTLEFGISGKDGQGTGVQKLKLKTCGSEFKGNLYRCVKEIIQNSVLYRSLTGSFLGRLFLKGQTRNNEECPEPFRGDPAQIHASFPNAKDISDTNIVDVIQIRRLDDSRSWATEALSECK
jgi:hypothetical protein